MARNEEKANAALNRWVAMKSRERLGYHDRRPLRTTDVTTIVEAEKWRQEVVREISEKTTQIQNAFLGEQRIREMNDTINNLLQEKRRWERRIVELGGSNHGRSTLVYDSKGNVIGGGGSAKEYKYFGAARELPGVKEMLEERERIAREKANQHRRRKTSEASKQEEAELGVRSYKHVTPEYYGFPSLEDDETSLCLEEERFESSFLQAAQLKWDEDHQSSDLSSKAASDEYDADDYEDRIQRALLYTEHVQQQ